MAPRPRYEGAPVLSVPGSPRDQLEPLARQRRRLVRVLGELSDDQWHAPSRCVGWSVQDVAAHLVTVNQFWTLSVRAGRSGSPTRYLEGFDPVDTPARLVHDMRHLTPGSVLAQLAASTDELLGLLAGLDDDGWSALAETPLGHVPVRLLASHALWDSWVHERDVVLPLGASLPREPDEVRSSLRYVCALVGAFSVLGEAEVAGTFGVEASSPDDRFVLDVEGRVSLREASPAAGSPTLCGDAVALIDALSMRVPLAGDVPAEWRRLTDAFEATFAVRS